MARGRTGLVAALTLTVVLVLNQPRTRASAGWHPFCWACCRATRWRSSLGHGGALSDVGEAAWFSLPQLLPFGITFEPSGCIALGLLFAINSIQAIGDFTATTVGGLDRTSHGPRAAGRHRGLRRQQYPDGAAGRSAHGHVFPERGHRDHQQGGEPVRCSP